MRGYLVKALAPLGTPPLPKDIHTMQAGYAELDITPAPGIELTGYGYWLNRRAQGTLDPLMARALALRTEGDAAAIVQLDLLALGREFVDRVRNRISAQCEIPSDAVMLHCTHTHSGPATRFLYGCGDPDPAFVSQLEDRIVDVVAAACGALTPVKGMRWFDQDFRDGFAQNRTGGDALDTRVRGLWLDMGRAGPIGLVSYACHPVTLGRGIEYSADYCGAVIRELNAYGIRALYLNGCCGDVNPVVHRVRWGSGTADTLKIYGRDLAQHVRRANRKSVSIRTGEVRALSQYVHLDLNVPDNAELQTVIREAEDRLAANADDPRARVAVLWAQGLLQHRDGGTLERVCTAEIQALSVGDAVIVGLGAETFTNIGLILREMLPDRPLLIAATTNGVIGYIGDRRDVETGGYATTDACRIYGMAHPNPGAGEKWIREGAEHIHAWLHQT